MTPPAIFPAPLRQRGPSGAGSCVRVIAPAGPIDHTLLWRALGWLGERFELRYSRGIFARQGYLAGSDERRLQELQQALVEPGVDALICTRGGYGVSRIAHRVDWRLLRKQPRWLIGFSDITALHAEANAQGVASVHGCNAGGLGRGDARARANFLETLCAPNMARQHAMRTLRGGEARGQLCGGNLALVQACAAAGRLHLPPSAILFLEDIGESLYRLDRAMTTLVVGGHLASVTGVVLGQFTHCHPGPDGTTAEQMLAERLSALDVPVVAGLDSGHDLPNHALVFLQPAHIVAGADGAILRLESSNP